MADKILSFRIDAQGISKSAQDIAKIDQELRKLNEERRKAIKLSKESGTQTKQQAKDLAVLGSKITDLKTKRTQLNAEERKSAQLYQAGAGSVNQLNTQMARLRAQMNNINLTTKKGQQEWRRLNAQYERGTATLRQYNARLSGSARLQGAFSKGILGSFKSMAAGLIGVTALIRVFRDITKVTGDFDSSTARLAGTMGKSREEIQALTKDARHLGATTQFTASQVSDLQVELAKLGFTARDIQNATKPIIDFATATEADLGSAAKTAGVAVRAFGLDTLETADAVATLAIATTKSALSFADYETILSTVGPVAKAYGFTLEDTIALTAKLRDAGFDASKASTALRNIFLNLADSNGALAQKLGRNVETLDDLAAAMIELDDKGISLNETLGVTDKRSVSAFIALLEGSDSVKTLRDEITGANEQLSELVKTRLDSYAGDVKKLASAWEGLILTLKASDSIRRGIQFLTNAILQVSNLSLAIRKFNKQSEEELSRSFDLLEALSNKQGQAFSDLIDQFDGYSLEDILADPEYFRDRMAQIRNINKEEAGAIINEYIKRRWEQDNKEKEIEAARIKRIKEQEQDLIKNKAADEETARQEKFQKDEEAREKEYQAQVKALKRTQELLAAVKPIGDLKVDTFNVATKQFDTEALENAEGELFDFLSVMNESMNELTLSMATDLTERLIANSEKRFSYEEQKELELLELIKQVEQEKRNISYAAASETFNIFSGFIERRKQKIDQQLKDEIISEEEAEEEKRKLQKKAAIVEKGQALFNIAVNTAEGVLQYAKNPITLPLVPFIIALGAIQAGAVLAQPLPEFAGGGKVQKYDYGGRIASGDELPWANKDGDNTLVLAKPGEVIVNERQQAALGGSDTFRKIGVPGFADGGRVPSISPPVPGVGIDVETMVHALAKVINDKNVILNVNELNGAQKDLSVINSTSAL